MSLGNTCQHVGCSAPAMETEGTCVNHAMWRRCHQHSSELRYLENMLFHAERSNLCAWELRWVRIALAASKSVRQALSELGPLFEARAQNADPFREKCKALDP